MDTLSTTAIVTPGRPVFTTDEEREGVVFDTGGGAAQVEWNDTAERTWHPTSAFAEGGRYDDLYVQVTA